MDSKFKVCLVLLLLMPFASAWTDYADQNFCDTVVANVWGQKTFDECLAGVDPVLQEQYCGLLSGDRRAACALVNGTIDPARMPNVIGDGYLQSMGSCPIDRQPGKDYLCAKRDDAIRSAVYWKELAVNATSKCQRVYFFCVASNYYAQTYNPFNQVLNVDETCRSRIEAKVESNIKTNQTGWGAGEVCLFDYTQTKIGGSISAAQSQQILINDKMVQKVLQNLTNEARSIYTLPLGKGKFATSTTVSSSTSTTLPATASKTACQSDSDCIAIQADCCACNAGGSNIAISKSYKDTWVAQLSAKCKDKACLAVMSQDISCRSTPACQDNVCTLVLESNPTTTTTPTTVPPVTTSTILIIPTTTQPPTTTTESTTTTTLAASGSSGTSIAIYIVAFLLLIGGGYFIIKNIPRMSGADDTPQQKGLRGLGEGKHARIQAYGPSRLSSAGDSQAGSRKTERHHVEHAKQHDEKDGHHHEHSR
jgi:hypothetical protein